MGINRGINPWISTLPDPNLVPQFRGTWEAVAFETADIVTFGNSAYIALTPTLSTDRPTTSNKWAVWLEGDLIPVTIEAVQKSLADAKSAINHAATLHVEAEKLIQDVDITKYGLVKQAAETEAQLRSLSGVRSLGRAPKAGDVEGIYRFNNQDIYWNGSSVTATTPALATEQKFSNVVFQAELGDPQPNPQVDLKIPEKPKNWVGFENNSVRIVNKRPYGIAENAVGLSVMINTDNPRTQVAGFTKSSDLTWYKDSDSVTIFAENSVPPASWTGMCTFTATSATVVEGTIDWSFVNKGGYAQVEWAEGIIVRGLILDFNKDTKTIYVENWWRFGTNEPVIPDNGRRLNVRPISKVWVYNGNSIIHPGSQSTKATVCEYGVVNTKEDPTGDDYIWGVDVVSLGKFRATSAYIARSYTSENGFRNSYESLNPHQYAFVNTGSIQMDTEFCGLGGNVLETFKSVGHREFLLRGLRADNSVYFSITGDGSVNANSLELKNGMDLRGNGTAFIDFIGAGDLNADYNVRLVNDDDGQLTITGKTVRFLTPSISISAPSTPKSSSDPIGAVGEIRWDPAYFYVKTPEGWKRTALTTF